MPLNLSPIEQLDLTLDFFSKQPDHLYLDLMFDHFEKEYQINDVELRRIIIKLIDDKYIDRYTSSSGSASYAISFNGYIFQQEGGYSAMLLKPKMKLMHFLNLQARQNAVDDAMVMNTARLNNLTKGLLIATIFLAVFALVSLLLPYLICQKCK